MLIDVNFTQSLKAYDPMPDTDSGRIIDDICHPSNIEDGMVSTPVKYWNSSKDVYVFFVPKTPSIEVTAAASI